MKYQVEKYLTKSRKGEFKRRYTMRIGGLELYFDTIKEAEEYYQVYCK